MFNGENLLWKFATVHLEQEIDELMAQIYKTVAKVDVAFSLPDLSSALRDIQTQYDSIAAQNLQVVSYYRNNPNILLALAYKFSIYCGNKDLIGCVNYFLNKLDANVILYRTNTILKKLTFRSAFTHSSLTHFGLISVGNGCMVQDKVPGHEYSINPACGICERDKRRSCGLQKGC